MVQVPVYNRSVADRPILRQNLTVRAAPDDFGAGIGQGLAGLAQGVGQVADVMSQLREVEDLTAAKEADNALAAWKREALYGEAGYLSLSGKAAVDARAGVEKGFEDKRRELGAALKSPGAQRRFMEAAEDRFEGFAETLAGHSSLERKRWIMDTSVSRLTTFGQDAVAAATDPAGIDRAIAGGQDELARQAALEGWSPETLQLKSEQYVSGIHANVAISRAAQDPLAAAAYFETHRDAMTGPDQLTLEQALGPAVTSERAKQETAAILDRIDAGDGDIETALAAIEDPEVRELTALSVAGTLQAQQAAEEAQAQALRKEAADRVFLDGQSPLTFELQLQAALGVQGMKDLTTTFNELKSGPRLSDPELKHDLYGLLAADPRGFARHNLQDDRIAGRLNHEDYIRFAQQQAQIGAGEKPALAPALALSREALAGVGLKLEGLEGPERGAVAGRIAEFNDALAARIDTYQASHNGQSPDQAEVNSMINALLLPIVIMPQAPGLFEDPLGLFGMGMPQFDEGWMFDAHARPAGSTVLVPLDYDDVPLDERAQIEQDLGKITPGGGFSEQDVVDAYRRDVLGL
jgi:hypothetical protein